MADDLTNCGHRIPDQRVDVGTIKSNPHSHYFKNVRHLNTIDVYRVLRLFDVTDPCLQHAIKKALVAGGRGGGKDVTRDIQEAIDSLKRYLDMNAEDALSGPAPDWEICTEGTND